VKILFDEDAPRPLRRHLTGHNIITVQEMNWSGIKNGNLLTLAEGQDFEVLLTFDQNLPYQQNLAARKIGVLVIVVPNKKMDTVLPLVPQILAMLPTVQPGQACRIEKIPEDQNS
jgi:hypothetical protein